MLINKLMGRTAGIAVAAIIGAAAAQPAYAQGGVNIVPWAGIYVPTRNNIETLDNDIFERDVSVMGGARLEFWGTGRLGFEVTGGYAPAKIAGETINERTNLLAASGRLLFAISPPTNPVGFYLGVGPALLTRGRNPLDDDASNTDFGGTAGIGFRFGSGQNSRLGVRVDFEDYMYNGDLGGGDKFQHDLVGSLGLTIALGGSPD
jgi:Outer membrane protein beta-barrel domain